MKPTRIDTFLAKMPLTLGTGNTLSNHAIGTLSLPCFVVTLFSLTTITTLMAVSSLKVVCGRGGSATTRYIDLVVGLEDTDNDSGGEPPSVEFSNIVREDLPSLQVKGVR